MAFLRFTNAETGATRVLNTEYVIYVEKDPESEGALIAQTYLDATRDAPVRAAVLLSPLLEPGRDTGAKAEPPAVTPGPWVGTVESLDPGRELVARRRLDLKEDPVAAQHTLVKKTDRLVAETDHREELHHGRDGD